ncbi:unnamed protein product [Rhizophagus irregularis]|nr:unnamed protein product [Rhizophagus irregularis]
MWNKNDSTVYVKDYKSNGYKKPEVDAENQFVTILSQSTLNGVTQVEISRPLNAPNRRPIPNSMITLIYAWNPNSMEFSYHGGNRGATKVNFFQYSIPCFNIYCSIFETYRFLYVSAS